MKSTQPVVHSHKLLVYLHHQGPNDLELKVIVSIITI